MKKIGVENFSLKDLMNTTNPMVFRSALSRLMDFVNFQKRLLPYIEERRSSMVCDFLILDC